MVRELNLNGPSRVITSISLPVCLSLSPHLAIFLSIAPHPILFSFFQSLSLCFPVYRSQGASLVAQGNESTCNTGNERDLGLIPGSGRSPQEGNGNPLQYSCLENPMDRGAWWAAVDLAIEHTPKPGDLLSY